MIQTPLGIIEITKDGRNVDCLIRKMRNDNRCPELSGRFAVLVDYIPDGQTHTISCCIKGYRGSKNDFIEPDERVDIKSFCKGTTKLSLGLFSDVPDEWGKVPDEPLDYWTEYLKNGVQYYIRAGAKQAIYPFSVAWTDRRSDKNEDQTSYGADPTIWWDEVCAEESFLLCCVKQEIDKWDPYDFFPDAPSNEYDGESRRIVRRITISSLVEEIAEAVAEVFSESFGQGEGFTVAYCRNVAGKIEHRITKYENRLKNGR